MCSVELISVTLTKAIYRLEAVPCFRVRVRMTRIENSPNYSTH